MNFLGQSLLISFTPWTQYSKKKSKRTPKVLINLVDPYIRMKEA
jgi:hypothetical protein